MGKTKKVSNGLNFRPHSDKIEEKGDEITDLENDIFADIILLENESDELGKNTPIIFSDDRIVGEIVDVKEKEPLSPMKKMPDLHIPEKEGCSSACPFYTNQTPHCNNDLPACGCEAPILGSHYKKFCDIGYCKNCGHFIIRIGENTWTHYRRAYRCGFPYNELKCCAMKDHIIETPDLSKNLQKKGNE